jgi:cholinesterase
MYVLLQTSQWSTVLIMEQHGKICLATNDHPLNSATDEDCLFIDVYAPTSASSKSNLPVYFFIQGGGFVANSNANYDGSGLIAASGQQILVVTFNYRVGPYGFLAGQQVLDSPTGSLNNGLLDQRKALAWVQKYISFFGGDPKHVVLGGDSAGAASIAHHLTAYGGRNDNVFVGAAAESVSFAPELTPEESQYQYDTLASLIGCATPTAQVQTPSSSPKGDPLSCLRSKSAFDIQSVNHNYAYAGNKQPPVFMWNPVLDGDLLLNYTRALFQSGSFIRVPMIFGDDTNAGTIFANKKASGPSDSHNFLQANFPHLTTQQLAKIDSLYPNEGPDFPSSGTWWRQVSNAYGDLRYMCPTLFISSIAAKFGLQGNWNYRYNVEDPQQMSQGLGVPHTVELHAIWGPSNTNVGAPDSYWPGKQNAWITPMMQQYWISFIRTLDPNQMRAAGAPLWATFTLPDELNTVDTVQWRRLLLDTPTTTGMEAVNSTVRARCQYLNDIGLSLRQ